MTPVLTHLPRAFKRRWPIRRARCLAPLLMVTTMVFAPAQATAITQPACSQQAPATGLPDRSGGAAELATPLPVNGFWQLLAETRRVVEAVCQPLTAEDADRLTDEADLWLTVTQIVYPDGQVQPVVTGGLVAALRMRPFDRAAVLTQLDATLAWRSAARAPAGSEADLDTLPGIFARPEFQTGEEPFWQRWQRQFLEWVQSLVPDVMIDNAPAGTGELLTIGLVVVLLGVLLFAARGLVGNLAGDARARTVAHEQPLTSDAALDRAQALSAEGDYRSAVRFLYLAALLKLDERGLLRYDRSLTNREVLRRVRGRPDLVAHLRDVIDVFDRVWYGFQRIDADGYRQYADDVRALDRMRLER